MITSTSNPRIRNIQNLKKKARERNAQGLFLIEGVKMFSEVPRDLLCEVYASESFVNRSGASELLKDVPFEVVSDRVFESISDTESPQGILCTVRQFAYRPEDLLRGTDRSISDTETIQRMASSGEKQICPMCVVLENLQDPGNLGTIMRTAEGAGVTGILLGPGCVDIYNPKVIRSTMGSVLRVPFCYTDNLYRTLCAWKAKGITLFAAHLKGDHVYTREDYTRPCAFLIGNESRGLTDETAALADLCVQIPMLGRVESLNASVAASLLMYEGLRQRMLTAAFRSV